MLPALLGVGFLPFFYPSFNTVAINLLQARLNKVNLLPQYMFKLHIVVSNERIMPKLKQLRAR
jgi:hypothetical protein